MSLKKQLPILCPHCGSSLGIISNVKEKCDCGFNTNKIAGVPLLWSAGREEPFDLTNEAQTLPTMDSSKINIPFVRDSINSGKLVLELGAGVDTCLAENLVKTDAFVYSSNLDICADAHNIPFEDNTFDFVFSLAVFEHLHSPWVAAEEIYRVLKPGGIVYTLTAFNQHVHGYPYHYFNMTDMGLKRIFEKFIDIKTGPSPFCPLDQISYSLLDLREMNEKLYEESSDYRAKELNTSIDNIVSLLGQIGPDLISCKEARGAWSKIAPGMDCYATKPKLSS